MNKTKALETSASLKGFNTKEQIIFFSLEANLNEIVIIKHIRGKNLRREKSLSGLEKYVQNL